MDAHTHGQQINCIRLLEELVRTGNFRSRLPGYCAIEKTHRGKHV